VLAAVRSETRCSRSVRAEARLSELVRVRSGRPPRSRWLGGDPRLRRRLLQRRRRAQRQHSAQCRLRSVWSRPVRLPGDVQHHAGVRRVPDREPDVDGRESRHGHHRYPRSPSRLYGPVDGRRSELGEGRLPLHRRRNGSRSDVGGLRRTPRSISRARISRRGTRSTRPRCSTECTRVGARTMAIRRRRACG